MSDVKLSPLSEFDNNYIASASQLSCSLAKWRGPIMNQYDTNACTGYGTAGMLNSLFKRLTGMKYRFSPEWIWKNGKKQAGIPIDANQGTTTVSLCKSVVKNGLIEDDIYQKHDMSPPVKYVIKVGSLYRLPSYNAEIMKQSIRSYIGNEKLPVGICMKYMPKSMDYADAHGELIPSSKDKLSGHHWCYIDEYDKEGVTMVNSYGEYWAEDGTCFIPWKYLSYFVVECWSFDAKLP